MRVEAWQDDDGHLHRTEIECTTANVRRVAAHRRIQEINMYVSWFRDVTRMKRCLRPNVMERQFFEALIESGYKIVVRD